MFADIEAYLDTITDRRSLSSWYVFRSLWFCVGLCSSYLLFVLWLGPRLMAKRAPFVLKRAVIVYNIFQVVANVIYTYKMAHIIYTTEFSIWCQSVLYNHVDQYAMDLYNMVFYFYILKILDLMDTVIMVLRKKTKQASFLHISHHVLIVIMMWMSHRIYPGGPPQVAALINCAVHSIMYSYYLLATLHVPGLILIKPCITKIQLVQFVFNILHQSLSALFGGCEPPLVMNYSIVGTNIFFFFLFSAFYKKNYRHEGHQGFVRKVM